MQRFQHQLASGLALALLSIFFSPAMTQAAEPSFLGTWKVNMAKSTFNPGPPPKSLTRTDVDMGGGLVLSTTEGIDSKGERVSSRHVFRTDGKDYPVAGSANGLFVSYTVIDPLHLDLGMKIEGKVISKATIVFSADGKIHTLSVKGTSPQGKPMDIIEVWEKQ